MTCINNIQCLKLQKKTKVNTEVLSIHRISIVSSGLILGELIFGRIFEFIGGITFRGTLLFGIYVPCFVC